MKKTYTIHGMSCNSCKEKIEKNYLKQRVLKSIKLN